MLTWTTKDDAAAVIKNGRAAITVAEAPGNSAGGVFFCWVDNFRFRKRAA